MSDGRRIISLDIIRGFAILGIFLVNMLSFHSPMLYLDPFTWWSSTAEQWTYIVIDVMAQGSFYPLFSLLFGYSLVLLQKKTVRNGLSFTPLLTKRLFILLGIGVLHAVFIWHGDILINYALLGLITIPFLKYSQRALLLAGTCLWFIPNFLLSCLLLVAFFLAPQESLQLADPEKISASIQAYQQGSMTEIFSQRIEDWYLVNQPLNSIFMLFSIFPFFLIGAGVAKGNWLEKAERLKKSVFLCFVLFSVIGLTLKLTPYLFIGHYTFEFIQDTFGGPMLAAAYACGITWLLETTTKIRKILFVLAPVGKMSMSNYLFQSIVSTCLFYSYGLGLYGHVSIHWGTILVLFIFALQVMLSSYWLKAHSYGPVEWIWRSLTYGKKQAWKRHQKG